MSSDKARLEAISAFKKLKFNFGDYKAKYAWVSQRGYYPDDLNKANQDSFFATPSFNGDKNMSFFAVLDGHGQKGHLCAQFAREYC